MVQHHSEGVFFGQIHPRDSSWEFGFQLWQCQVGAAKLISLHINSSFQGKKNLWQIQRFGFLFSVESRGNHQIIPSRAATFANLIARQKRSFPGNIPPEKQQKTNLGAQEFILG